MKINTTNNTLQVDLPIYKRIKAEWFFLYLIYCGLIALAWLKFDYQPFNSFNTNKNSHLNEGLICSSALVSNAAIQSLPHSGSSVATPVGSNTSGLKRWSDPASWLGNIKPGPGDDVLIPANSILLLDENITVKSITVKGKLIADLNKNFTINTEYIVVSGSSGYFEIGTPTEPYSNKATLTLTGSDITKKIPGTAIESKALLVEDNAVLELHGKIKTSWSNLNANAAAGSNLITIATATNNWQIGDEILITPSRLNENEGEQRTITAISPDKKTFTLNTALSFPHIGQSKQYTRQTDGKTWTADLRAEVGLLTKSITIQGDADSETNQFGAHVMIHMSGIAHVEGIELFRAGQKSILGRYPFHWHLIQEKGAGQYFRNNSVHRSYNRAITIHGTESTLVENNFCYDHIGHGIFLEDGSERFNTIRGNVVLLTKRPLPGEQIVPSDNEANEVQNRTPASFWITNPNNIFENNVAAGTQGTGFWFAMPRQPMGPSLNLPRFAGMEPFKEPLGKFSGNKAHSCASGFDIFDQLTATHSLIKNGAWERTDIRILDKCTWYACDLAIYGGIGGGRQYTEGVIFKDNIFSDNVTSVMHANYSMVQQSLFVANSGENVFTGERMLNRGYDGACTIKDCHMAGWQASNANYVQNTGGAMKHVNYRVSGMTMDHPGPPRMSFPDYSKIPKGGVGANDAEHPRFWSYIHWDKDGTLGGKVNTSIITNHPLCRDGSEVRFANWTNLYRTDRRFAYMLIDAPGDPKMTLVRTKAGTPKAGQYYINGDAPDGYYGTFIHFPVIVNDGFLYTLQFESLGTGKTMNIHMMDDYVPGDQVLYRIKDFGKLPGILISNATRYNTLNEVKSAGQSAYYVEANGDVYLKMVSVVNPDIVCKLTWTSDITLPLLDTDGDGVSDYQESVNGTDPIPNDPIQLNPVLAVPVIQTVWEFPVNGDSEGWTKANNVTGNVAGGSQQLQVTGTDPQYISSANLLIPASTYRYLRFRVKSSNAGALQLYWSTDGASGMSGTKVLVLPIQSSTAFTEYYIDMSASPEWKGSIYQLRVDPEIGTGQNIEIDRISFETTAPTCSATITSPANSFCAGGSVVLTANAGTFYKWMNGTTQVGTAQTYTATAPGSYTVEVTNVNGCKTTSAAKTITVDALPVATITSPANTFCTGGSVVLTASSGTSYKWFNGTTQVGTAATYTATAAGSYTVEVTNAAGCKATSAVKTITTDALPVATITSPANTFCAGGSVVLTASSGTSYKWFNGTTQVGTAATYTTTAAGSYTVEVTNAAGCKATSAVKTITTDALPVATITSPANTFCAGGSVVLTASSGTSYKWFNGTTQVGTSATYTATTAGSYTVEVTNAAGCKATSAVKTITVDALPVATITSPANTFCTGGSVVLTASNGTSYKWFNGTTQVGTAATYSATDAGSYTVEVTNTAGCKATSAVKTITVDALPVATITSPANTFCAGGSVVLTASSGTSYKWFNGTTQVGTAATYTAAAAGSYTVEVTNTAGCKATSAAKTITVDALPVATITSPANTFCTGGSVVLTASSGTSYKWFNGTTQVGTAATYTATDAGSYIVEVTNAAGCKATSAVKTITVTASTVWYADTDGDGKGDPAATQNSCTQPSGYVATAGDNCPADPTKIDPGNCGCNNTETSCLDCAGVPNGTASMDACMVCSGGTTGITPITNPALCGTTTATTQGSNPYTIRALPNPFNDRIDLTIPEDAHIQVIDMRGSILIETDNTSTLFTSHLSNGLYILRISTTDGTSILKMMKQ